MRISLLLLLAAIDVSLGSVDLFFAETYSVEIDLKNGTTVIQICDQLDATYFSSNRPVTLVNCRSDDKLTLIENWVPKKNYWMSNITMYIDDNKLLEFRGQGRTIRTDGSINTVEYNAYLTTTRAPYKYGYLFYAGTTDTATNTGSFVVTTQLTKES